MSHHQHAPIAPKNFSRAARLAAGSLTTRFGKMSFQLPLQWSQSGVSLFQATRQAARQKLLALRSSGDMRSWPWFLGPGIHRARTTAATRTQEFLFLARKVSVFAQNHLGTQSRRQMRVILLYRRPVGLFGVIFKGLKKVSWRALYFYVFGLWEAEFWISIRAVLRFKLVLWLWLSCFVQAAAVLYSCLSLSWFKSVTPPAKIWKNSLLALT